MSIRREVLGIPEKSLRRTKPGNRPRDLDGRREQESRQKPGAFFGSCRRAIEVESSNKSGGMVS